MLPSEYDSEVRKIVANALAEDIGTGDVTTQSIVPADLWLEGNFVARAPGVIAGLDIALLVFQLLDARVETKSFVTDGQRVENLQQIARVYGPAQALLSGERTALNLLQRMSGIATQTARYVQAVQGTSVAILDTRKTVPGLRILDKMAVRMGGGHNHRTGLFDRVLIKNNHIAAVNGDIYETLRRVHAHDPQHLPVEIEVRNFQELDAALKVAAIYPEVDRILLDNMNPDQLRQAVAIVSGKVALEASGNFNLDNIAEAAKTGVNFISSGALTHSVKALDISLWLDSPSQKE